MRALLVRIRGNHSLPKLHQHYAKHGEGFRILGIVDVHRYSAFLRLHVVRSDTQVFTFISTKLTQHRMWIFVGMDNGVVAQYNETREKMWSFYRQAYLDRYVQSGRGKWIRVLEAGPEVQFETW